VLTAAVVGKALLDSWAAIFNDASQIVSRSAYLVVLVIYLSQSCSS